MEALNVLNTKMVVNLSPDRLKKMVVNLSPDRLKNVHQAVLRALSSLLFTFNDQFDGIVLAYEFNILDEIHNILPGIYPYFSVRLDAKLLVFSPKPDMLLEGKVVTVEQECIHIILLEFLPAVITEKDIRKEFQYKNKHGKEVFVNRAHKNHVIKAGTWIRLLVKSVNEEALCISGSLLSADTGNIVWLDKHMEVVSPMEGSKKKRGDEGESVMQEPSRISSEASSSLTDHSSKKSKKHKTREES